MSHSFTGMHRRLISTFGVAVTHTPAAGSPTVLTMVSADTVSMPEGTDPSIHVIYWTLAENFVTAPASGDLLTVGALNYTVVQVRQDGDDVLYLIATR